MSETEKKLEAILFASSESLTEAELAQVLALPTEEVRQGLEQLSKLLSTRGIRLLETAGHYQLVTAPEAASAVSAFLSIQASTEVSAPGLEVMAVILKNQPVTKGGIEEIRGVASDQTIKNLLVRGLIIESGKSPEPGHPPLYSLSPKSLRLLGITHSDDLIMEVADENK